MGGELSRLHCFQRTIVICLKIPSNFADSGKREPLCAFLNKPVPEKDFPSRNAPPAFVEHIAEKRAPQYRHARVNAAKTLGVVLVAIVALWMGYARLI